MNGIELEVKCPHCGMVNGCETFEYIDNSYMEIDVYIICDECGEELQIKFEMETTVKVV
jgi:DNA-directed RNA polymerase subunit RPC12/RpoP